MAPAVGTDLEYTPPDGGWGWVVVLGAFISMGFSYAFSKAVTVFYKEIQEFFGASYSEIAWISSLLLAVMYAGGPVSSILVNRYGSRPVVMFGGLLSGIGMILATFSTSIIQLYICIGIVADMLLPEMSGCGLPSYRPWSIHVYEIAWGNAYQPTDILAMPLVLDIYRYSALTYIISSRFIGLWCGQSGFGFSMNLQPSVIVVGQYFLKNRPLANGLAMAGSPVVLSTLAPLNQFLFDNYGWRGSFLILGALLFNCCVAGALFRPIGPNTPKTKKDKDKAIQNEDPEKVNISLVEPSKVVIPEEKESCMTKFTRALDLTLFKHRGFMIYLIGNVVMFIGFYAPIVFLAAYGKHLGVDEYSSAFLLSILAMVDMIARPATGLIANTKWIRPRVQYFFSCSIIFNGICHLMCPLATGYLGLVVYSVFFGLAFGMVCSQIFETLMDLVGAKRFSSAVGLVTIVECVPLLLGPPIGGAIVDTFGDYKYMFFECGAILVAAGLFLFVGNFYNYRMLRKEAEAESHDQKEDIEMKDEPNLKKHDYDQVSTDEKAKNDNEVLPAKDNSEKCEDVNGSGHQC